MSGDGSASAVFGRWVLAEREGAAAILHDHYVILEDGLIQEVTPRRPEGLEVYAPGHALVLPGLINAHNHCGSSILFRGITEDRSSSEASGELIYRLLMPLGDLAVEVLSDDEMAAVMELGLLEIIKGGTTTLFEIYRPGQIKTFEAAARMGLRFYGGPYVFSTAKTNFSGGQITYETRGDETLDLGWLHALHARYDGAAGGRLRVAIAPHGCDTCGPELLRAVRALADELGCLITIHLSQSEPERAIVQERYGVSPEQYLADCGLLGPDLVVAHCVYSEDADLELLRESDTTVVSCPRTFARSGLMAPFGRFTAKGIRTVIGTDGYNMDMVTELRAAGYASKLFARDSAAATAWDLVGAATAGGAAALRRPDLGRIAPGARADLTVIDMDRPNIQPVGEPIKTFVWNATAADVAAVVVDGEFLVRDGRFLRADEAAIIRAGTAAVNKAWDAAIARGIVTPEDLGRPAG